MHAIVSVLVLVAVLAFAVVRPRGLPELVAAVPGAGVVLAAGPPRHSGAPRGWWAGGAAPSARSLSTLPPPPPRPGPG